MDKLVTQIWINLVDIFLAFDATNFFHNHGICSDIKHT